MMEQRLGYTHSPSFNALLPSVVIITLKCRLLLHFYLERLNIRPVFVGDSLFVFAHLTIYHYTFFGKFMLLIIVMICLKFESILSYFCCKLQSNNVVCLHLLFVNTFL